MLNKSIILRFAKVLIFISALSVLLFKTNLSPFSSFRSGIGLSSSNKQNEWHYEFNYLHGKVQGAFEVEEDGNNQLIYSTNIEKGSVTFELFNAEDSLLSTLPAQNTTDTLCLFLKKGNYRVKATAEKAKGSFDMKMNRTNVGH